VPPDEIARQLGIVLTREVWINAAELSDAPEGTIGDGLPPDRERLTMIRARAGDVALLLGRVELDGGLRVWLIASSTVARTAELYEEFGYGPLVETLADRLPPVSFLGVELFKWVFALGAGLDRLPSPRGRSLARRARH
jgi:hypothetical protein